MYTIWDNGKADGGCTILCVVPHIPDRLAVAVWSCGNATAMTALNTRSSHVCSPVAKETTMEGWCLCMRPLRQRQPSAGPMYVECAGNGKRGGGGIVWGASIVLCFIGMIWKSYLDWRYQGNALPIVGMNACIVVGCKEAVGCRLQHDSVWRCWPLLEQRCSMCSGVKGRLRT